MDDRNVQFPTRYRMIKVPGTDDIFDMIPAPGTVYNEGTPINKANLLTDAVTNLIGLTGDVVPNDMMRVLATAGDLHVWRRTVEMFEKIPAKYSLGPTQGKTPLTYPKTPTTQATFHYGKSISIDDNGGTTPAVPPGTYIDYPVSVNPNAYQGGADGSEKPAGYTLGAVKTGKKALSDLSNYIYSVTWQYGDSVAVSDDGKVSIKNPTQIFISATNDSEIEKAKVILGKFATPMSNCGFEYGKIYFFPSDSQISRESLPIYDTTTTNIDKYQEVTGYPATPAGTTIEYLGVLGDKSRMQVVSYVGTGTCGSGNKTVVSFYFAPSIIFIFGYAKNNNVDFGVFVKGFSVSPAFLLDANVDSIYPRINNFTLDSGELSLYNIGDSRSQFNAEGKKYTAIGFA